MLGPPYLEILDPPPFVTHLEEKGQTLVWMAQRDKLRERN